MFVNFFNILISTF